MLYCLILSFLAKYNIRSCYHHVIHFFEMWNTFVCKTVNAGISVLHRPISSYSIAIYVYVERYFVFFRCARVCFNMMFCVCLVICRHICSLWCNKRIIIKSSILIYL